MNGGAIFITLIINCVVIYILHVLHKQSIAKTVQNLRKEVSELENLVSAIIEEFEEVADKVWQTGNEEPFEEPSDKKVELKEEKPIELSIDEPIETSDDGDEIESPILDGFFANFPEVKQEAPPETIPMFQPQEIMDPKHNRILQLWKDGLAIEEIAKLLGTGRGEIQLILGIYKRS